MQCSENSANRIPLNSVLTGFHNMTELSLCTKQVSNFESVIANFQFYSFSTRIRCISRNKSPFLLHPMICYSCAFSRMHTRELSWFDITPSALLPMFYRENLRSRIHILGRFSFRPPIHSVIFVHIRQTWQHCFGNRPDDNPKNLYDVSFIVDEIINR